jgi:hypothetical protein
MSEDGVTETDERPYRFGVIDLIIAIVIGFLFVYAAYVAIGNLIGVPNAVAALHKGSVPWVSLIAAVVLPIVVFVGCLLLGRGRPSFDRALILIAGIAATSAATLTLLFVSFSSLQLL